MHCSYRTISARHRKLAEIMEMIHTASLVHDDVLDECNIRRGQCDRRGGDCGAWVGDFEVLEVWAG